MNIRKYFIAINCTLSHKAFVLSPPLGEVGKGLPLTTDEWDFADIHIPFYFAYLVRHLYFCSW